MNPNNTTGFITFSSIIGYQNFVSFTQFNSNNPMTFSQIPLNITVNPLCNQNYLAGTSFNVTAINPYGVPVNWSYQAPSELSLALTNATNTSVSVQILNSGYNNLVPAIVAQSGIFSYSNIFNLYAYLAGPAINIYGTLGTNNLTINWSPYNKANSNTTYNFQYTTTITYNTYTNLQTILSFYNNYAQIAVAISGDGNTLLFGSALNNTATIYKYLNNSWGSSYTLQNLIGTGVSFGCSVSLSYDGNTAIVGANNYNSGQGYAAVYKYTNGSWSSPMALTNTTGSGSLFGNAVAISGDGNTALVGAPFYFGSQQYGYVAFYTYSNGSWSAPFVPTNPLYDSQLGSSVALNYNGTIAIVGGVYYNFFVGAAAIFNYSSGTWSVQQTFIGTTIYGSSPQFGHSVSLNSAGTIAIISSQSVYFAIKVYNGSSWVTQGTNTYLTESYNIQTVALNGDGTIAVIGMNGGIGTGGLSDVYIYKNNDWNYSQTLSNGQNVAINSNGSSIIIADGYTNANAIVAYYFKGNLPTNYNINNITSGFGPINSILPINTGSSTFGGSVAINSTGTIAIVGAYITNNYNGWAGIYTSNISNGTWNNPIVLTNPLSGGAYFGWSVAINSAGTTAIVGAYINNNDVGWAGIYTSNISNGTWNNPIVLTNPISGSSAQFGYSVAISGDGNTAIVGAPFNRDISGLIGWAGIYTSNISSGTWNSAIALVIPISGYADFGCSVALNSTGTVAIVGAYNYNNYVGWAGIYTSNISNGTWNSAIALTNPLSGSTSQFGWSVALNSAGTVAIVGANRYYSSGYLGWAGIYTSNISNGTWNSATSLNPFAAGTYYGDSFFGWSVALNSAGTVAIVGAQGYDNYLGWAGTYTSNISTGTWISSTPLANPGNGSSSVSFGWSVAINSAGTVAIVGAQNYNNYQGWVGIYNANFLGYIVNPQNTLIPYTITSSNQNGIGASTVYIYEYAASAITLGIITPTSITLSWIPYKGIEYEDPPNYSISTTPSSVTAITPSSFSNAFNFNGLTAGTYYTFTLTSLSSSNYAGGSITSSSIVYSLPVTNLTTSTLGRTQANLSWTISASATLYNINTIPISYSSTNILINSGAILNNITGNTGNISLTGNTASSSSSLGSNVGSNGCNVGPLNFGNFGTSIAISGDGNTLVVGVAYGNSGSGYVAIYNNTTTSGWSTTPTQIISMAGINADFGASVGINYNGTEIIIGAPNAVYTIGTQAYTGYVAIYKYSAGTWTGPTVLVNPGAFATPYGFSVAINGNANSVTTSLVGSPTYNIGIQSYAVLFNSQYPNGYIITNPTGDINSEFGYSVALSYDGNTAIIGAPNANNGIGYVAIYTATNGWNTPISLLYNYTNVTKSLFGYCVSISSDGTTALVGAPGGGPQGYGYAGIYSCNVATKSWSNLSNPTSTLNNPYTSASGFGFSVSLGSNVAIVGAPNYQYGNAITYNYLNNTWNNSSSNIYTYIAGATYTQLGFNVGISSSGGSIAISATNTPYIVTYNSSVYIPQTATNYLLNKLLPSTTYQAIVTSVNNVGQLCGSSILSFMTSQ